MSDVKGTLANITKTAAKTSGSIIKTAKLNISLANEESALRMIYIDIGKKVHELYSYGGSLGKAFDDKYTEILEAEKKIKSLRDQIDAAKGRTTCPHCGKTAVKGSDYCPSCGKSLSEIPIVKEPRVTEAPPEVSAAAQAAPSERAEPENAGGGQSVTYKACPVCGAKNGTDEKFCLSCGRMMN